MQSTGIISKHLSEAFEGGNWSDVWVRDIVQDISLPEAITITEASPNSIASLIYHMMAYNKAICRRLNGEEPQIGEANGFDMPALHNEQDWQQLLFDAFTSARALADAIGDFPEKKLFDEKPPGKGTYYKKIHGVIEHNYYHLGQIRILKGLIRSKS